MNNIEKIVQNEPLEDVVSAFGIGLAYPSIDRIFVKYRFEVIANGELLKPTQNFLKTPYWLTATVR
ncbi:MAG: hypothetical protein RSE94_06300 [Pseudomonas sp.]